MQKLVTFLMFEGKAEEAINFYLSLFSDSEIVNITRYSKNEPGAEGSIKLATILLHGQEFMFIDSPAKHDFTFTPSISIYVNCGTEEEIDNLFNKLSQDGKIFMPLATYPFSKKFGWTNDKYGVSWQLNLVN